MHAIDLDICLRAPDTALIPPAFEIFNHLARDAPPHRFGRVPQVQRFHKRRIEILVHSSESCVLADRRDLGSRAPVRLSSAASPAACRNERTSSASSSTLTPGSTAILANRMRKISFRVSRSGAPTYRILSRRPGRIRAESWRSARARIVNGSRRPAIRQALTSTSGLFVAATTVTPDNSSIPSISFNKLVRTPECAPSSLRAEPSASISSCRQRNPLEPKETYKEDD